AKHWEKKVQVRVMLALSRLVSLVQHTHTLSTQNIKNTCSDQIYPAEKVLRIPPNKVWQTPVPIQITFHACVSVAYFPFDWQSCIVVFRSYTYNSSEVDLQYALDENGEELQEIDENAFIGYWVIMFKPSLYHLPDNTEKMTLTITVLIADTVSMLLTDKVPETSLAIPLVVNYVMFTMIVVTFSVILSVVVLNLHHCFYFFHHIPSWSEVYIHSISIWSESTVQLQRFFDSDNYCLILPPDLKSAIAAVTYMAEQLKKQDGTDWQYIAIVVDRLFLWLFVIILNYTPDEPFPLGL
uniref:Cholinergic receptor, nicotinic, beta 1 (muscle) like n=1 Tax=Salmo trutta TaxID=8032 RepID=A0A674EAR6_SALTR